ncbi:CoA-transferase family III [Daldinia caldariorum]|uniref:CoA-transferase family III n=1 Tax=Daldinia caldariorum TaxID=326644 RepID=UPI0020084869|nr:CoA-transferase family III [Daldinia caldariorum]KAI1464693.1 CoA-transferase family III [Daldinia caldariorum]
MTVKQTKTAPPATREESGTHSVSEGSKDAFSRLLKTTKAEVPMAFLRYIENVKFLRYSRSGDTACFPCPLREQETVAALKALEGCAAAAIADIRGTKRKRTINVTLESVAAFLMSTYITSIDGLDKCNPKSKERIPDTDLNQAQSVLYRRLSAGLYETRNQGEYYHIHGSLEATKTLKMIGLPAFSPGLTDYHACISTIEGAVKQFSGAELERLNREHGQAGVPVLTNEKFRKSSHGKSMASLPLFTVKPLNIDTPPVPFTEQPINGPSQCLQGLRVIELCRVIAGPTIGRSLAAHGASVLKVTSSQLPDVPFFQLDVNTGKHTTSLHLKNAGDVEIFRSLLETADVIIDGYRPGVIARLGYRPEDLAAKAARRGRGIVYVAEDCFGGIEIEAEWAGRPGWQQIADCVTGVAWEQGSFMGLNEPVIPPFPMSDYGTGCVGTVAALSGIYRRATQGGSWICRTSLSQYDIFLLSLGMYPAEVQNKLRREHDPNFFELRHNDSVDEIGRRALASVRSLHPTLFANHLMQSAYSEGFGGIVTWPKEPLTVSGIKIGHVRPTRPNGYDKPTWEHWERDESLLDA